MPYEPELDNPGAAVTPARPATRAVSKRDLTRENLIEMGIDPTTTEAQVLLGCAAGAQAARAPMPAASNHEQWAAEFLATVQSEGKPHKRYVDYLAALKRRADLADKLAEVLRIIVDGPARAVPRGKFPEWDNAFAALAEYEQETARW